MREYDNRKKYYCPICGLPNMPITKHDIIKCSYCENEVELIETQNDFIYYSRKAINLYNDIELSYKVILEEESSKNSMYNEEISKKATEKMILIHNTPSYYYPAEIAKMNQPKCPTCKSTNIERISTTSKVVGAALFGLFSTTAKSQFKCKHCGYKW